MMGPVMLIYIASYFSMVSGSRNQSPTTHMDTESNSNTVKAERSERKASFTMLDRKKKKKKFMFIINLRYVSITISGLWRLPVSKGLYL